MTQHAGLTEERWGRFDIDQRILMIGNELNRTTRLLDDREPATRRRGYERVLRLTDLTVALCDRRALRRELLRWRDLAAVLYADDAPQRELHRAALRALLLLRPVAARQIPHLYG